MMGQPTEPLAFYISIPTYAIVTTLSIYIVCYVIKALYNPPHSPAFWGSILLLYLKGTLSSLSMNANSARVKLIILSLLYQLPLCCGSVFCVDATVDLGTVLNKVRHIYSLWIGQGNIHWITDLSEDKGLFSAWRIIALCEIISSWLAAIRETVWLWAASTQIMLNAGGGSCFSADW